MTFWDQAPALIGVVLGAAGSYAASSGTERSRWKRAREERWDEKRFHIYANYANTLKAQLRIAQRIAVARGMPDVVDPLQPDDGLAKLAEAETNRAAEWEAVLLVGDTGTIAALRRWHDDLWAAERFARGLEDDPADWTVALQRVSEARDSFFICARNHLGILGPSSPEWPEHRLGRRDVRDV